MIGGDFNTDFSRNNSHKTWMLNEFIENEELLHWPLEFQEFKCLYNYGYVNFLFKYILKTVTLCTNIKH